MEKITLKLTVDEANIILKSLGKRPFEKVYALINKINQQASAQLNSNGQMSHQVAEQVVSTAEKEETL